jgi:hypothetical protein
MIVKPNSFIVRELVGNSTDFHGATGEKPVPDGIFLHKLIDLFSRQQTAETGFLLTTTGRVFCPKETQKT